MGVSEGMEGIGWGSVGGHLERPPQALPHDSPHRCPAGQRAQSELALGAGPRLHSSADGRVHRRHLPASAGR